MIQGGRNSKTMACDCCGEVFGVEAGYTFSELIADAKQEGWRLSQEHGEWKHLCQDESCQLVPVTDRLAAARKKFGR